MTERGRVTVCFTVTMGGCYFQYSYKNQVLIENFGVNLNYATENTRIEHDLGVMNESGLKKLLQDYCNQ